MAWVVDAVVYFPAYPEVPSGVAVYVTAHKVQDLRKQLEGKIFGQQSQKTYLQIVEDDVRLNKSYPGELKLSEGYRTAPSGLILPVSEFSAPPNNLHSANSRINWRAWMRNAAANLIIGIGWAVPYFLFVGFIASMVIWGEQVFGPIVDYLLRPGTTPLTHQDLIILMIGSVTVIALVRVFRMIELVLAVWIRETNLLSWRVRDPSRFTPEVISNLRTTLPKQSNLTDNAVP